MRHVLYILGALVTVGVVALCIGYVRYNGSQLPAQVIMMTAVVPGCGNGLIEDAEECDGSELLGASCQSKGFVSGTLSCTSSCLYNVTACVAATSSSSGGGGGGKNTSSSTSNTAQVVFSGRAYPASLVTVLLDGKIIVTSVANADANFQAVASGLAAGRHNFSLYAVDGQKRRSALTTIPIVLTKGILGKIEAIFIAPTIAADKVQVKQAEAIVFSGQTAPSAVVTLTVGKATINTFASIDGTYKLAFDTSTLKQGTYTAIVRAVLNKVSSTPSNLYTFTVGKSTLPSVVPKNCPTMADLNDDCRVNLVDFSILGFWFQQKLTPAFAVREKEHLNGDGKVNITDFSIMAFNWTG